MVRTIWLTGGFSDRQTDWTSKACVTRVFDHGRYLLKACLGRAYIK